MLKVACESCGAPYQIDEKRVPKTGLKMRCPKCGGYDVQRVGARVGGERRLPQDEKDAERENDADPCTLSHRCAPYEELCSWGEESRPELAAPGDWIMRGAL